jgi:hypothetical protein
MEKDENELPGLCLPSILSGHRATLNNVVSNQQIILSEDKLTCSIQETNRHAMRHVRAANGFRIHPTNYACSFFEVTLADWNARENDKADVVARFRVGYRTKSTFFLGNNSPSWSLYGNVGEQCRLVHLVENIDCGPPGGASYGDVIGVLLNLSNGELYYFVNGLYVGHVLTIAQDEELNVYPAAGFCRLNITFNFGKQGFCYLPKLTFSSPSLLNVIIPSPTIEMAGISEEVKVSSFVGMLRQNLDSLVVISRELSLRDRVYLRCSNNWLERKFKESERPLDMFLTNVREYMEEKNPFLPTWYYRTLGVSFDVILNPFAFELRNLPSGVASNFFIRFKKEKDKTSVCSLIHSFI